MKYKLNDNAFLIISNLNRKYTFLDITEIILGLKRNLNKIPKSKIEELEKMGIIKRI